VGFLCSCSVFKSERVNFLEPGSSFEAKPGTLSYFLPTGRVRIQLNEMTDGSLTITTSVLYVPDPTQACLFRYRDNYLSHEHIKVPLTDNGLLSAVTSTHTDATPQIVQGLGELAINTLKIAASAAGGGPASLQPQMTIDEVIDPLNGRDLGRLNATLAWIGVRLETVTPDAPVGGAVSTFTPPPEGRDDGILYRPAIPYRMTFISEPTMARSVGGVPPPKNLAAPGIVSTSIALPNEAPILAIDVSRRPFITTSATIAFNNGMLKDIEYTKPSEAAGLVQIPVDLSKQVLAVPTDLTTIRFMNLANQSKLQTETVTHQSTLLEDQAALLKARTDLIAAQKALKDAQEQQKKGDNCAPDPQTGLKPPGCP
jgi:hypothetical protein